MRRDGVPVASRPEARCGYAEMLAESPFVPDKARRRARRPGAQGAYDGSRPQWQGTRSAPGVSHREYLLPGHQTGAIRGTQDQLTRMNLPLPPAMVGGRRAITGQGTPGN